MKMLLTGGVRSGKSHHGEQIALTYPNVTYLATSQRRDDDPEWQSRIRLHESRRPAHWNVLETLDIAGELSRDDSAVVLVDCIGVWLTRILTQTECWQEPLPQTCLQAARQHCEDLVTAVKNTHRDVILVTNEVGWGVVPAYASGRLFADELGRLNANLAAICDEVTFYVAGIGVPIKSNGAKS
ncbi:MAG: bifunctional adenosylcobinamide kinase/adenosylcobinamide-phosphate guanylyltransferase [Propionibacteriaceae bacterium]